MNQKMQKKNFVPWRLKVSVDISSYINFGKLMGLYLQ